MKLKIFLLLFLFSSYSFAQEANVEVGKHANVNLDALSMILSLLMVLAVIVVAAWLLKQFNLVNKTTANMSVVSSLSLGNKERLVVVQVADEQLLLAVSGQQINLIKTLPEPLAVDNSPHSLPLESFSNLFNKTKINKNTQGQNETTN